MQALKINEKDPAIWTRLGFLEYDQFKDLSLAKQCFEAAIQTYKTIDKRSSVINPILVKLSEIAFQEFDYKKAEEMVDAILSRQNDKDRKDPLFFAYVLKAFLLSL